MKVAVLLSGVDRCFNKVVDAFMENIVKPYNADVYTHVWSNVSDRFGPSNPDLVTLSKISRKMIVEDYSKYVPKSDKPRNITPMFYGIEQAEHLSRGPGYDFIIRSRFDSFYNEKLVIPSDDAERVYVRFNGVNHGGYYPRNSFRLENSDLPFVADNFAVGSSRVMRIYCSTHSFLPIYNLETPECLLAKNLTDSKVGYDWLHNFRFMSLIDKKGDSCIFESNYDTVKRIIL